MTDALVKYRNIWQHKPVLRLLYDDFFERIANSVVDGPTLELGGGIGNLREKIPALISSDIQFAPWLDLVADAQKLPFAANSLSNIVMLDVLHHVEFPSLLFREAARVLRENGRIVMVEPGISLGSTLFYRVLHHEPVVMNADPLAEGAPDRHRDPYAANQAIPTLLVGRDSEAFHAKFPEFRIVDTHWFSFVAYPCSGGFKPWSLVSEAVARRILWAEKKLERWCGRLFGFRLLIVIEKRTNGPLP
ncbi:class I SAM-dependent methyltransferase [Bradyrhizobium sp. AUGA SZCCT0158]|uniref:class I SAM-dependent methyltransferase n=1 Tax=Bradyrhizobium sp. AUGA SZCCT0158 TaxID=2807661 RepID=UPI001BA47551|nr:class I SAM-dependent methyltransferase [Bradyrhizobium sp. AUGA SZCCT0158]MBR1199478.1 class I SAM-dependent methyltransferase [Bradyrhizobium sp. AUGA SZCCT0158]